jgi:excisionase family DNA binding protein
MIATSTHMSEKDCAKEVDIDKLAERARVSELAAKLTWLKPYEAACYMNVGESTLWRLIAEGTIPSCKDSGNVRILRTDIDAYWINRRRSTNGG